MLRVRDVSGRDDLKATWGGYMFFFVKGLAMLPNYAGQCSVCLCVRVSRSPARSLSFDFALSLCRCLFVPPYLSVFLLPAALSLFLPPALSEC